MIVNTVIKAHIIKDFMQPTVGMVKEIVAKFH